MSITKENIQELQTIYKDEKCIIEEMISEEGNLQYVMFINGFMSVDEIIHKVKIYNVSEVHYTVGTSETHTFPLIMKTRRKCFDNQKYDFIFDTDNAQTIYPII